MMNRLLLTLLLSPLAHADEGLVARWTLRADGITEGLVSSDGGTPRIIARLIGSPKTEPDGPRSLTLSGDGGAREHLVVDPGTIDLPDQALSVEAWVRIDRGVDWGGIIGANQDNGSDERGWLLGYDKSRFYFGVRAERPGKFTYLRAGGAYLTGYWYHVVGTFDGKTQRIFVDGKLAGEANGQRGAIFYGETPPLTIGAYRDDDELRALEGSIESVAIWNRPLAKEEVARSFDTRKANFPDVEATVPPHLDWPTYRHDNLRTGTTSVTLELPLRRAWSVRPSSPPAPAWAPPAKRDFWHRKTKLSPRVVYDRAFHIVADRDRVYFGSSSTDSVYCLSASTGETLWVFTTEGPVRLAPTIAGGRILFGSDDGSVYCLDAEHGRLLWRHSPDDDVRIAGNERIISRHPIRSGILVEGAQATFCAGLFPEQGVHQIVVDISTGRQLSKVPVKVSAQGYLEHRSGRLFAPTGRDPAGQLLRRLQRRGKPLPRQTRRLPEEYRFAWIRAGDTCFGGGDGQIAAISPVDANKLWTASVDGKAYSLAATPGRLFVSTDRGEISCFIEANQNDSVKRIEPAAIASAKPLDRELDEHAARLLERIERAGAPSRGYALLATEESIQLVDVLSRRSKLQWVAVARDEEAVRKTRTQLLSSGRYGPTSIHHADESNLPYASDLFSIVVASDSGWSIEEIRRVVAPGGLVVDKRHETERWTKPLPAGAGEWTHMYSDASNRAASGDELVAGRVELQWFGRPGPRDMVDRHHRTVPPLCARGKLFVPGADKIFALNAYNGAVLWEREIPDSTRVAAFRDSGSMATDGDVLFVASGRTCVELDTREGSERTVHELPNDSRERGDEWGLVAIDKRRLFGSCVENGAIRRQQSLDAVQDAYYDARPIITSSALFARRRGSSELLWIRTGTFLQPTVTIGGGRLHAVECSIDPALGSSTTRIPGRYRLDAAFAQPARVIALDLESGETLWSRELDLLALEHNVYGLYDTDRFVLVGSRNSGPNPKKDRILYDIFALDATTGRIVWSRTQRQPAAIGGAHGEQDLHPLIQNGQLICEPFSYTLADGSPSPGWKWRPGSRRGCGGLSGSARALFFRQSHPTAFNVSAGTTTKITTVTRPGCWINMIPAGGMLLVPEASSGCTCNYAVQGSMGFRPIR